MIAKNPAIPNKKSWFRWFLSRLKVFFSSPPPELDESHAETRYRGLLQAYRLQDIRKLSLLLDKFFEIKLDLIISFDGKRYNITELADSAITEIEYLNEQQEKLMTREEWQEYERAVLEECNSAKETK